MRIREIIGIWSAAIVSAAVRKAKALVRDRSGHVAMIFGIATIPMFVTVGIAVDMAQQSRVHLKLSSTSDSIALAAARSYKDKANRDTIGDKYLDANLQADYGPGVKVKSLSVDFDDDARLVTVRLVADVPTIMMGIAGIYKTTADIQSVVTYEGEVSEPVSLGLVLDVSGSMGKGSPSKISTLRNAGRRLLERLEDADPDSVYVRTGLTTYNHKLGHTVGMHWGVNNTLYRVNKLGAKGGTASAAAVRQVGDWLVGNNELLMHKDQPVHHGKEFNLNRFVIFMTDGKNELNPSDPNGVQQDAWTKAECDDIKTDGVEIYTVAFSAPEQGKQLLQYCASSENHYYDATDEAAFLEAFDEIGERLENTLLRIVD